MSKRAIATSLGLAVLGSGLTGRPALADVPSVEWAPCPDKDPVEGARLKGLECGKLAVPLNYDRPDGRQITLALTRARHTAKDFQGIALLNRGGPGAHGRDMPVLFTRSLPKAVAATYDWIGVDPRGVGASKPALVCDESYQNPGKPRADTTPGSPEQEEAWQARARKFADDCAAKYGDVLPYMGTSAWVRDLDAVRVALGQDKINYFGYSYGSYLGAAYATRFPGRVRRMVLDSVVRPSGVWYDNNLDQDVAFEKRIRAFFTWIAEHHDVYRLGSRGRAVERAYYAARASLAAKPINGRVGGTELDDLFLSDGYADYGWTDHAQALSDYVVRHDTKALAKQWKPVDWLEQNNYTVYNAVQCRDAAWPRDWATWHHDNWRLYRSGNRFETWSNAWYNAPCASWAFPGDLAPQIGALDAPGILLVQATEDAATPYPGAIEMHGRFPSSRLLVQLGGGNHGVALGGDQCVDKAVTAYLRDGSLPPDKKGPDSTCQAGPSPEPNTERTARLVSHLVIPLGSHTS